MFALRPLVLLAALGSASALALAQGPAPAWSSGRSAGSSPFESSEYETSGHGPPSQVHRVGGRYAAPPHRPTRDEFAGGHRALPDERYEAHAPTARPRPAADWDGHAGPHGRTVGGPLDGPNRGPIVRDFDERPYVRSAAAGGDWPLLDRRSERVRPVQYDPHAPLPEPVYGPPPPAYENFPPRRPPEQPIESGRAWDDDRGWGDRHPGDYGGDLPCDGPVCRTWNCECDTCCDGNTWTWQLLPQGFLYRSYLAGPKESRLAATWVHDGDEYLFDGTLGGRFGLFRYGTVGARDAEGYQLGFEGAALLRMNWTHDLDMDGTDYRFGIPLTYARGPWEWRFGYYHLSSHTGDEYLVRNGTLVRENYVRDAMNLGIAYFVTDALRVYGEASFAFRDYAGAKPWHFQCGFDYSPVVFGPKGSPFVAANAGFREEVNYGGGVNVQVGWQWQQPYNEHLFRIGLRYYNGESTQYSFFDEHQELIGAGIWYDY